MKRHYGSPITVDLPSELIGLLGPTPAQAAAYLKQLALIDLVRRGEISSGKAAEVLGMPRWDFLRVLAEHKVPYLDLSEEELRQDVATASRYRHRVWSSPTPGR